MRIIDAGMVHCTNRFHLPFRGAMEVYYEDWRTPVSGGHVFIFESLWINFVSFFSVGDYRPYISFCALRTYAELEGRLVRFRTFYLFLYSSVIFYID